MAELVVITGAGVNADLEDFHGRHPPLATNFFNQLDVPPGYAGLVFDYIEKYWGLSFDGLTSESFDLEECFTLIQQQKNEARGEELAQLRSVELALIGLLRGFLSDFLPKEHEYVEDDWTINAERRAFNDFASLIWECRAPVITFNYDSLLEEAIAAASGHRVPITRWNEHRSETEDAEEAFLQFERNWHKPLGYGFKFDYVEIRRKIRQGGGARHVPKLEYYRQHRSDLVFPPFLKMHGSLDWYRHSGEWSEFAPWMWRSKGWKATLRTVVDPRRHLTRGRTILKLHPTHSFSESMMMGVNGEALDAVLVTPVLHKTFPDTLGRIWKLAREELAQCRNLIVAGYSFPTADYSAKQMFLEVFSNARPENVWVIDPNDSVRTFVRRVTRQKEVNPTDNLTEFSEKYAEEVRTCV